jgi:nucleoside-diphosphate-sugar epimerase
VGRKRTEGGRVLVAGGAGFLGSNLVRRLIAEGHTVDCIDNLITGRAENVADLERNPRFCFVEGDITDWRLMEVFHKRRYTEVYNLACPTGVPNIAILGEEMLMASSVGTLNLIKVAQRSGSRFLFASTAEAYGDPEVFPQPEDYVGNVDPVGARSPYEEGKRFGEALTAYQARRHGTDARIVRIFNTYGPAMSPDDKRLIPQLLLRIARGEPVTVYGDGRQTRTLLYVDDLVDGLLCAMRNGSAGNVYNVGGDREMSILEVVETAAKVIGRRVKIRFQPHFIEDHHRRRPDTSRIRALGWLPQRDLEEGLRLSYAAMVATLELPELKASQAGAGSRTSKAPPEPLAKIALQ